MTAPSPDADLLREFLRERDVACPNCSYNLRGLELDRCPECAQDIRLQVGLVEPRLVSYLTGLVGLAFGAGFYAIVLVWAGVYLLLYANHGYPSSDEFTMIAVGSLVSIGCLLAWLRGRARLRRLTAGARAAAAAACWLLTAILATGFFTMVR